MVRVDNSGKSNTLIQVRGLDKTYRRGGEEIQVLQRLNLDVDKGDFVAFMGPSGSGKSTLLYMLGGLERPTSGKVLLHDQDLSTLNDDALSRVRRTQMGFVFQFYNLIPVLTAKENVAMPLILDGVSHADALKRAGTTDEPKLRDAIASTKDFRGVTGNITLGPDRNPVGKKIVVIEIKDEQLTLAMTIDPSAKK